MRHPLWFGLQGGFNDGVSSGLVVARFASTSGCHLPYLTDAQFLHALAPQVHGRAADFETGRHDLVLLACPGGQDNAATERHLLRSAVG
jgi:hypothetical protein